MFGLQTLPGNGSIQANYFLYKEIKTQAFFFTLAFLKTVFWFSTPNCKLQTQLNYSFTLHMFKDLLFLLFTQVFCLVLCLVLMEVEDFLKLFFSCSVILEAGKGMDMSILCNTEHMD